MNKKTDFLKDLMINYARHAGAEYILLGKDSDNQLAIMGYSSPLSEIFTDYSDKKTPDQFFVSEDSEYLSTAVDSTWSIEEFKPAGKKIFRREFVKFLIISSGDGQIGLLLLRSEKSAHTPEVNDSGEKLSGKSDKDLSQLEELQKKNAELEKAYSQLAVDEEMFRQFTENTNDIFWVRNEKELLYLNNQFDRILGRNRQELIENPYKISEWIHPEDRDTIEPWVNMAHLVKGKPYVEQYRIVRPDGKVRWLWSRIFPVLNEEGNIYRLIGIASDITEQKEFEEALTIAKEKAQESDMLKSSFLANISHEIRTPMNGIVGFAELISRDDLDNSTRKTYVNIMKKSSEQLVRIIDDIIDFAKIEANQINISQEKVNINKLLDQLMIIFENQLVKNDKNNITLLLEKGLEDEDSEILTDEHRVRQILFYLMDNAIKFTSEGFIKLGYKVTPERLEFFVKDSGIGIEADKLNIIFERFRQGDEGNTRKFGGTGLGLPISKGLVNLLGGSIWVESTPGNGCTFFFTIPFKVDRERIQTGKIAEEPGKYLWPDKLVLVAEDDELNFEYMKVILEPTQARIIRAKDGSQAVKMCANLNFDIILMDIRLPVINGIQATQTIREMGVKTPIIAQTAFAMDDDEQRCIDAGCNSYISKPISKEKLYTIIDSLISNLIRSCLFCRT